MSREQDFYIPIKKHFEKQGFDVKAEVNDCDCVCVKDDLMIICEFKLRFNITLVFQGLDRQKLADYVYLCIPKYKGKVGYRNFLKAKNLVTRLGLGLILVNLDNNNSVCEVVVLPQNVGIRKNTKKKNNLIKEYNGRKFDLNQGGQTGQKINTVFRETCIRLLCAFEIEEEISTRKLVAYYGFEKGVTGILYRNALGYFSRTNKKGVYRMSNIGKLALDNIDNEQLVTFFREELKKISV